MIFNYLYAFIPLFTVKKYSIHIDGKPNLLMCFFIYKPINLPIMKKYFLAGTWCSLLIGITFMACSKQETVLPSPTTVQLVQALKGDSSVNGLITQSNATALQASFIEKRGEQETRLVKISVKDLINYLHQMQANAYTDSIGIHMGIYTAASVPVAHPEYLGKQTLYFSVFTKAKEGNSDTKSFGNSDGKAYLNHGTLYP